MGVMCVKRHKSAVFGVTGSLLLARCGRREKPDLLSGRGLTSSTRSAVPFNFLFICVC